MLSILLCDDDPLFLNELQATITQILPQEQLSFTCCTKGADCMEAVQRGLIPDVAFVDIALPDVDGISVAAQIYQCCPSIPFIFITAYNNRYSQQVFLRDINLCGYVTKPINENFLRVQISRALRKHTENTLLKVGASQDGIYLAATEIFYIESQKKNIYQGEFLSLPRQAKPSRTPFGKGFFQNSQQLSCQHGACTTVIKYRGSIE